MPDTVSEALRNWHDFYLLVGGASATLAGLMLVAMSLRSGLATERVGVQTFVRPTLIHFVYVLATASVVLIPTMTRTLLGVLLVLVGLTSFGFTLWTLPYLHRGYQKREVDTADLVWSFLMPSVSYLLYVGTGVGLLKGDRQAFSGLAVVTVLLLVVGIHNAWDLVVWRVVRKAESPTAEGGAGRPAPEHRADPVAQFQFRKDPSEKPTSLALPASYQAEVARMIQEAGLDPRNFTWALQPNRHALIGPLISAVVHTPTGCFFRFEFAEDVHGQSRVSVFIPDKGAPEVTKAAESWEDQLGHVRGWLKHLAEGRR
jgi:hypothetical protein